MNTQDDSSTTVTVSITYRLNRHTQPCSTGAIEEMLRFVLMQEGDAEQLEVDSDDLTWESITVHPQA